MGKSVLISIIAAFLIGCNSPKTGQKPADSVSSNTFPPSPFPINKTPVIFKGLYTLGSEVNTFRDCRSGLTYWVNDSIKGMREPYEKTLLPLSYPYESVYAEVKGYLSGKSKLGYAAEYENVLVITDIEKLEAKNFKTECYPFEFIALGNEPFWSVDIVPEERLIVLKDLGLDKVFRFPYQSANIGGGVHRFETSNAAKDKLVIIIREEPCSDGMSDRQYRYSAEVVINGRILKGCAVKKDAGTRNQKS